MWHVRRIREIHTRFWWWILKQGDCLEDRGVDLRIILKGAFNKQDGKTWILILLNMGKLAGFCKHVYVLPGSIKVISWPAEEVLYFKEVLCSMELVEKWKTYKKKDQIHWKETSCAQQAWGKREMRTELKERFREGRDHFEDVSFTEGNVECILMTLCVKIRSRLIWLGMGSFGRPIGIRQWLSGHHKRRSKLMAFTLASWSWK